MLIDHRKLRLNELNVACRESADHFEASAHEVEVQAWRECFLRMSRERRDWANQLEEFIRRFGYPKEPDPEKEAVHHLIERVRVVFAADERAALLKSRERDEQHLAALVTAALQEELPEDLRLFLASLLERIAAGQRELAAMEQARTAQ